MKKDLPKGYHCTCHRDNKFSGYVYAHWDIPLTHTCECGKGWNIIRGKVLDLPACECNERRECTSNAT